MRMYDIDVNTVVPSNGQSVTPSYNKFSFQTNGDGVYNYAVEEVFSVGNSSLTTQKQFIYWGTEQRLEDKQTVNIVAPLTDASNYIGANLGFRIYNFGIPLVFSVYNPYYLQMYGEFQPQSFPSISTGDKVWLYQDSISGIHDEYYVNVRTNGTVLYSNGTLHSPSISMYTNIDDARAGYAQQGAVQFVVGTVYNIRKVVYTPIISLNLISARPTIQLDTDYADQTLTYNSQENTYTCVNSNINMHFTLPNIYTQIYKYRMLEYVSQYGDSTLEPINIGEWIYSKDIYHNVRSQRNGTSLYLAVEAYDTLNTLYRTAFQQSGTGVYQYALAINFNYSGYYPSLPMVPVATENCANGYDLISWESALLLYGGTYPLDANNEYTGYTKISNFITTNNNAINLQTGYALRYARNDKYHTPSKLTIEYGSSLPIFLWQPSYDNFSGNIISYGDGLGNLLEVYISNNRLYRRYTSADNSSYVMDDGAFAPLKSVVYIIGITNDRVLFRPYFMSGYEHNSLDFNLVDGTNVL